MQYSILSLLQLAFFLLARVLLKFMNGVHSFLSLSTVPLCGCTKFAICSSVAGHLGCFGGEQSCYKHQVQVLCERKFSFLLGNTQRWGRSVKCKCVFMRNVEPISQSDLTVCTQQPRCHGLQLFCILAIFIAVFILVFLIVALICIFLMTNLIDHLLICHPCHFCLNSLPTFKIGLFVFSFFEKLWIQVIC